MAIDVGRAEEVFVTSATQASCPCKLCGSETIRKFEIDYPEGRYPILECKVCALRFIDFVDDPSTVSEDSAGYIETQLHSNDDRFRWQVEAVSQRAVPGRVLDVGAGGGRFLAELKQGGWTEGVTGIEPKTSRRQFALNRYDIDLRPFEITHGSWDGEAFSAITMWDVIEHMQDPAGAVRRAAELLEPGGKLFLETPTRECAYYKGADLVYRLTGRPTLLRSMYYAPRTYGHKQIFTAAQLEMLMRRYGLDRVEVVRFHELSFPTAHYLRRIVKLPQLVKTLDPIVGLVLKATRVRNKVMVIGTKPDDVRAPSLHADLSTPHPSRTDREDRAAVA
ncbi:MAG: class I SAM-dependent methyltransferase [Pseudomonadota bacterium]